MTWRPELLSHQDQTLVVAVGIAFFLAVIISAVINRARRNRHAFDVYKRELNRELDRQRYQRDGF